MLTLLTSELFWRGFNSTMFGYKVIVRIIITLRSDMHLPNLGLALSPLYTAVANSPTNAYKLVWIFNVPTDSSVQYSRNKQSENPVTFYSQKRERWKF